MSKTLQHNLESRAQLFKALGHPARLLILNLAHSKPRHGQELAHILQLTPATVSHHLAILTEAGLLCARQDQYYHIYSLVNAPLEKKLGELIQLPQPDLHITSAENAYCAKVLRTFFRQGRLTQIPAQLKKQQIILEKLAQEFEPERSYTEAEVNQILLEFHDDVATLRRGLISHGLMERTHNIYRRTLTPPE
jgi:biotin operon repressor